jgi:ketosteroid isomerase-like protein
MPEDSTTPDLVELARRSVEVAGEGDLDAIMAFYTPDAVWDMSPLGMGTFAGQAAVRGFMEDWFASYEEWELQMVEVQDLGSAVTFGVLIQKGRPVGSSGEVELRFGTVNVWEDGKIARITNYTDIDEARATAERLAEERADG